MGEITEVCRRFLSKNAFFKEVCSFWNFLNRTWMKVELNGGITGGARKEEGRQRRKEEGGRREREGSTVGARYKHTHIYIYASIH